jgi:radical SAM protein with 4Fe4S-binding SPASM domain
MSARTIREGEPYRPKFVVWELTMRCDHACAHCGSRAVKARPDELSTEELLDVARSLVASGCEEVNLIGGEAYLHPGYLDVTRFLADAGVRVAMQTGGRGLTPRIAKRLKAAGMAAIGVSIDGPEAVHDELRASRGSFKAAIGALEAAREAGMRTASNCQVNTLNAPYLRETVEAVAKTGIVAWRAQLTAPMGRAADRPEWILQPWQVLDVIDTLAEIQLGLAQQAHDNGTPIRRILDIQLGNNLGYYGPHEQILRSHPGGDAMVYRGCQAGTYTLGIESDGTIKGCPSLPTAPYVGGNVRDDELLDVWESSEALTFARDRGTSELWGFCKTCMYAEICKAGCSFTAHTTLGRRGNMPFCYYRASSFKKQGLRERLVHKEAAAGQPYDFGRFELEVEPWPES